MLRLLAAAASAASRSFLSATSLRMRERASVLAFGSRPAIKEPLLDVKDSLLAAEPMESLVRGERPLDARVPEERLVEGDAGGAASSAWWLLSSRLLSDLRLPLLSSDRRRSLVDGGVFSVFSDRSEGVAVVADDLAGRVRGLAPLPRRVFFGKDGATAGLGVRLRLLSPIRLLLSSMRLVLSSILDMLPFNREEAPPDAFRELPFIRRPLSSILLSLRLLRSGLGVPDLALPDS